MGGRLGFNFSFVRLEVPIQTGFETAAAHEVAIGDFNNDGRLDFVIGYFLYPLENRGVPIRLMLQQSDGSLIDGAPAIFGNSVPTTVFTRDIRVADFNGDGIDDIFVADHGHDLPPFPGEPNDLLLSGSGSYSVASGGWSAISDFTHSAASCDIDGDGDVDIMVNNIGAERPYFLINDGSGGFSVNTSRLPAYFETIHPSTSTEFLDFDNDGDLDLFLGSGQLSTWTSRVLVNDGTGNFAANQLQVPIVYSVPNDVVVDTAVVDFNNDGWDDLVVSVTDYGASRTIRFLQNQGGTGFVDTTAFNLPALSQATWAIRIHFADFNGDGFQDMYLARSTPDAIFLNDGQGRFYQMDGLWPSFSIQYDLLVPGDINNDGRIDLIGSHGISAAEGKEFFLVHYNLDTPATQTGDDTTDALMGDNDAESLFGMGGDDILFGSGGNDLLDGGAGADYLNGGFGDDTYVVDSALDTVFELEFGGDDTIQTALDTYLPAHFEHLVLLGSANLYGVGTAGANTLTGNAGANLLIAWAGDDTVSGGAGGDSLFGEGGADTLNGEAGIDYLAGGIGNDTLGGGADADSLYGEDGDDYLDGGTSFHTDILVGGIGNDTLYGISGQANPDYDLMDGGAGDDLYYVDTGDDLTFEALGGGTDTVRANVTVSNAGVYLYANVENLILEGTTAFGVGNELNNTLTGSASGNWLLGGAGNDRINGAAGNDVLFGESGADSFVFDFGSGADVIGDFNLAEDVIEFLGIFTSFVQAQANFVQVGNDGAIDLGDGNLIVLHGVTMANLTAANFIFAPAAEAPSAASKQVATIESPSFRLEALDAADYIDHGLSRWMPGLHEGPVYG